MNNQQTPEKAVIDEVIESLIKRTELLEKQQVVKNEALLAKEKETQVLLASFDSKYSNIVIQAPKPDMSGVTAELSNGLADINETLGKWSRPLKKEYRFLLFPEHLRSVEYVKAVLTRVILGFIGLVFLICIYLLADKHIH